MRRPQALLASTLIGAGVFAFVVTDSVDDGCPVSIDVHDVGSDPLQVEWEASATRTSSVVAGVRVPDPWQRLGDGTTTVEGGGIAGRTFTVPGPCDVDRQYRVVVTQGDAAWTERFPGTTGWSRATSIHVASWRATKRAADSGR